MTIRMTRYLILAVLWLIPSLALAERPPVPSPAAASAQLGIAAVVNDEAISNADVEARMRLALLGAGIAPPAEAIARLKGQILRSMIDERLQLQEAAKYNITVPEADIDAEIARMAEQNRQTAASLPNFFASKGVNISTLRAQIQGAMAWALVVQRRLRPQVDIGDDEVDAEIARISSSAGQPQYLAAEIFLPVDTPAQEDGVKQTAQRLIEQMAKGARFSAVARQFSQSPSSASGGDLGWITQGQLEPQLDEALKRMAKGTLSPPIRTASGYHILMLRDQRVIPALQQARQPTATPAAAAPDPRQATLSLRQVLLAVPREASSEALQTATRKLEALRQQAKSCGDMERLAKQAGDTSGGSLGNLKVASLPPVLQPMLSALPVAEASAPMRNDKGILFLMVCARSYPDAPVAAAAAPPAAAPVAGVDRQQITNTLGQQKLELLARRYLRDLRQNAFIEVRG